MFDYDNEHNEALENNITLNYIIIIQQKQSHEELFPLSVLCWVGR